MAGRFVAAIVENSQNISKYSTNVGDFLLLVLVFLLLSESSTLAMAHSVTRRISARRLAMYERYVDRLRATDIDRLTKLCKMHLSFLMDLDKEQFEDLFTEKLDSKGLFTPFIRKKGKLYFNCQ